MWTGLGHKQPKLLSQLCIVVLVLLVSIYFIAIRIPTYPFLFYSNFFFHHFSSLFIIFHFTFPFCLCLPFPAHAFSVPPPSSPSSAFSVGGKRQNKGREPAAAPHLLIAGNARPKEFAVKVLQQGGCADAGQPSGGGWTGIIVPWVQILRKQIQIRNSLGFLSTLYFLFLPSEANIQLNSKKLTNL